MPHIDGNSIKVKDLNHAVGLAQNIENLKKEKAQLEYDIDMLMESKKYYEKELDEIKTSIIKSAKHTVTQHIKTKTSFYSTYLEPIPKLSFCRL